MLTHSSVNFWPDSHLSEVSRAITTVVWVRMTSSLWLENHKQLVTVRNGLHDLGHGWKDSLFLTHTQNHLRLTHIAKVTQPWAHFPLRLTCFIPFCHTFMCPSLLSVHLSILCPLFLQPSCDLTFYISSRTLLLPLYLISQIHVFPTSSCPYPSSPSLNTSLSLRSYLLQLYWTVYPSSAPSTPSSDLVYSAFICLILSVYPSIPDLLPPYIHPFSATSSLVLHRLTPSLLLDPALSPQALGSPRQHTRLQNHARTDRTITFTHTGRHLTH